MSHWFVQGLLSVLLGVVLFATIPALVELLGLLLVPIARRAPTFRVITSGILAFLGTCAAAWVLFSVGRMIGLHYLLVGIIVPFWVLSAKGFRRIDAAKRASRGQRTPVLSEYARLVGDCAGIILGSNVI